MWQQELVDAEGNAFDSNNLRMAGQRWSTFFTFTSPCVLERAGLLEHRPDGQSWIIKDNNLGCEPSSTLRGSDSGLVVDRDQIKMLFQHESVVSLSKADHFFAQAKRIASALPYIVVTVEPIYATQDASFGSVLVHQGLAMLTRWTGVTQIGATSLTGFVDEERDGEWFGVESDHAIWMDDCEYAPADDNDDGEEIAGQQRIDRGQDEQSESSVDNSMRVDLPSKEEDRDDGMVNSAEERNDSLPQICVGTRVSIQLNDSAVGKMFSFDNPENYDEDCKAKGNEDGNDNHLNAVDERRRRQKLFFDALSALEDFRRKFPLRCAPTDVVQCKPIPKLDISHGLKLSLYDYQRRAVHWLLKLEQREAVKQCGYRIPMHTSVQYYHLPLRFVDKKIVFDQKSIQPDTEILDVRGGIVAAKTGTGKTTMMIAAIHLQRCFEQDIARQPRRREDAVDLPDNRLPPLWSRVDRNLRFYANCTLVVCPRQMTQQWVDEFSKTLETNSEHALRIDVIRSVKDVRKLSIAYVQRNLDVLIVNKEIFKSPAYRKPLIDTKGMGVYMSVGERRWAELAASKWDYWNDNVHLNTFVHASNAATARDSLPVGAAFTCLNLHAIWWRRIVIDEVHELDRSWSMIERAVSSLQSDHTHGLTATPDFDSHAAFGHARDRSDAGDVVQTGYPALLNIGEGKDLLGSPKERYYFTRLHSITSSETVGMPTVHMHKVDVGLTPTEFAIYSSIRVQDLKRRLLFCSHHVLEDEQWQQLLRANNGSEDRMDDNDDDARLVRGPGLSMEMVAEAMQKSRKSKIKRLGAQLDRLQKRKQDLEREALKDFVDSEIYSRLADIYGAGDSEALLAQMARFASMGTVYVCRIVDEDREHAESLAAKEQMHAKQVALRTAVTAGQVGLSSEEKARLRDQVALQEAAIAALTEEIRPLARSMADLEREFNFFDAVFNRLSSPDTVVTCPICMDDEGTKQNVVLTSCGHEFCGECARGWFARSRRCPACRTTLNVQRDLRTVDRTAVPAAPQTSSRSAGDKQLAETGEDKDAQQLMDQSRHGSKVAALLSLIATIRARNDFKKLVIYAQFERLLKLVVEALKECGEQVLMVRGSAAQCQKAIAKFKSDPRCKIIVLSSENTISGIHLTEANHLIALHPILGTQEEAFAKHWQAIGRIRRLVQQNDCHVWSMVTRGTCEATMYDEQTAYAKQMLRRDEKIVWDR